MTGFKPCAVLAAAALLGGCALLAPAPLPPPAPAFDLIGRVAVTYDGHAFSSGMRWQHTQERDELWLLTPAGSLEWREDFRSAIEEARTAGRPYIVDFGADWCQACGELERETFADPRVMAEGARFVAVHVDLSPRLDTPDKRELLRSYAQRGLPLVVLHASDGREVHRVTQFMEPEEFLALMESVR